MGLAVGLGAVTADAVYGAIAGFGLTAISTPLVRQQGALRMIGGCSSATWESGRSWRGRPTTRCARPTRASWARFAATFGLT
jgi:threonine/homoserine/homoserine lactone efflux protein